MPWKKGVKFTNWEALYLPGGNNKFSRLFDKLINLLRSPRSISLLFEIIVHFLYKSFN